MESLKVSIYVPTKNRSKLLLRAVDSCLAQSYKNIEIIIVDDCSTDNTEEVAQAFVEQNSNIRYFKNTVPKGAPYSRNLAIRESLGEYVTGLDDDDCFTKDRIELFIKNYKSEYSFICSNMLFQRGFTSKMRGFYSGELPLSKMLFDNYVGNQIFIERTKLLEIGGFDETLKACQDYELWLRLIKKFGSAYKSKEATYIVFENDANNRISDKPTAYLGYYEVYLRDKKLMTKAQRCIRLFHIIRIQRKNLSFKKVVILFSNVKFHYAMKRLLSDLKAWI